MKIAPQRVLDVGVGFGRWGMVVREFCDVWFGRVLRHQWEVQIEGIEGFAPNLDDYHRAFYNKLHVGDLRVILPTLSETWDVVIFGDVLEHVAKDEALRLLDLTLAKSNYVLVNIPLGSDWPQDTLYENQFERHLSNWTGEEFEAFALRRRAIFSDFMDRPFGSFVLSPHDPQELGQQLFSRTTSAAARNVVAPQELSYTGPDLDGEAVLLGQIQTRLAELQTIKRSRGYRFLNRLQRSPLAIPWRGALALVSQTQHSPLRSVRQAKSRSGARVPGRPPAPGHIRILCTGQHHPASQGNEVWLLAAESQPGQHVDWNQVHTIGPWELRANAATPSGYCLYNSGQGYADLTANSMTRLTFMTHPWSGGVEVQRNSDKKLSADLYSEATGTVQISPLAGNAQLEMIPAAATHSVSRAQTVFAPPGANSAAMFSHAEREWIERQALKPVPLSVGVPQWRGVHSSARQLFDELYHLDDNLDEARGLHFAQLFAEAGCPAVVIQGFPLSYQYLVSALHKIAPRLPVYVIWHGSFLQTREDYAWEGFSAVEQFMRNATIAKWGFVKKGMAEIMARRGLRTGFVMNLVRNVQGVPSTPLNGGPHFGVWGLYDSWRKPPYAMLAAATLQSGAIVHAAGVSSRVKEYADLLGLNARLQTQPVEQERMQSLLAQMHLNLYVTLSECAPMLPLESLSAGAPCLLGPNSHYFEDHAYLLSRLVVSQPDSASCIASYLTRALEERSEIIHAYKTYAPTYNAQARECLSEFLELPVTWL